MCEWLRLCTHMFMYGPRLIFYNVAPTPAGACAPHPSRDGAAGCLATAAGASALHRGDLPGGLGPCAVSIFPQVTPALAAQDQIADPTELAVLQETETESKPWCILRGRRRGIQT